MTECTNVTIREMLPDLLHDSLQGINRSRVEDHVADCPECAAELDLLRAVHDSLLAAPALVSADRVAEAVMRPVPAARAHREAWLRAGRWRAAASIAVLLAGSAALAIHLDSRSSSGQRNHPSNTVQPIVVRPSASTAGSTHVASAVNESEAGRGPRRNGSITLGLDVSHLSAERLAKLLSDLDKVKSLPPADPESVYASMAIMGGN
jgi:anti-sigma factor RsiW